MFRLATHKDLPSIIKIYDAILEQETQTISYTNWQKGLYPTKEYAQDAIADKTMFVLESQETIIGCVILNHIQPKEYDAIPWKYSANKEDVIVIHTLCILPSFSKKGYATKLIQHCENYAKQQCAAVIRLDTYEGNIPACHLYPKLGYTYAGTTKFHFQNVIWENLNCYEKLL